MSTAVVSTSAALGRPFIFDDDAVPEASSLPPDPRLFTGARPPQRVHFPELSGNLAATDPRLANLTSASRLGVRPTPEMASSGIPAIDALAGGLPRGCLTEIYGPASSGRTTVLLAALAAATRRGEFCVLVDASDALDPHSVAAAGVELDRLLWVRCGDSSPRRHPSASLRAGSGTEKNPSPADRKSEPDQAESSNVKHRAEHRLEQLLRATDMLLESGGFGLIALDLCDLPLQAARRIPLTTWFRYRRAVEHTPTVLLAIEQYPIAGSCSSLLLQLKPSNKHESARWKHSEFSREAASCDSPARKCRAATEMRNESRRDDTSSALHDALQIAYPAHTQLLTGLGITVEITRSRLERKPSRSTSTAFASKTAWAG